MIKKLGNSFAWDKDENSLICLSNVTGVTIYLFSNGGALQGVISDNPYAEELYHAAQHRLIKLLNNAAVGLPDFLSESHGTSFFSVKTRRGILLLGPVLHMSTKESSYYEQFEVSKLSIAEKIRYRECFRYTPVIDYKRFVELALVINNFMNGKDVSVEELVAKRRLFYYTEPEEPFMYNRKRYARGDFPLDYQAQLIEIIQNGDVNALAGVLKKLSNWNFNFAADTPVKGYKLTFAAFSGVIMDECIRAGFDKDLAVRLCEYYIDWLERAKTIEDTFGIFIKMLYDYTERFYRKNTECLTKLSLDFEKYVSGRIGESISLSDAADFLKITPQYLCKKIRDDFGITPNKLIHKMKTEEAKKLLKEGKVPLSEMWLHLGYCDQSHFSKVFKEITGITPREYVYAETAG